MEDFPPLLQSVQTSKKHIDPPECHKPTYAAITKTTEAPSSPRSQNKSFVGVLANPVKNGGIPIKKATTFKGKPTLFFSEEEVSILSQPYRFALVGKLSFKRAGFSDLRKGFEKLGLRGAYTISALRPGYILINLKVEEDFNRLWAKAEIFVARTTLHLFKWIADFRYEAKSPLAPVWIGLPDIPLFCFNKVALFSIAGMIGTPLKIDEPTANRSRPSMACICVELNLLDTHPEEVTLGFGSVIFQQKILYEHIPHYCSICAHRGHTENVCFLNGNPKPKPKEAQGRKPPKPAENVWKKVENRKQKNPEQVPFGNVENVEKIFEKGECSNIFETLNNDTQQLFEEMPESPGKNATSKSKETKDKENLGPVVTKTSLSYFEEDVLKVSQNSGQIFSSPVLITMASCYLKDNRKNKQKTPRQKLKPFILVLGLLMSIQHYNGTKRSLS